ncbi:MAG: choice-of-anchor D domain-containing protein, partial [Candidatus Cloacimonetes bacterium]|nr:choice-of-anchor D domain-containing protein [Candidatus Cloacimonadota bacterium]
MNYIHRKKFRCFLNVIQIVRKEGNMRKLSILLVLLSLVGMLMGQNLFTEDFEGDTTAWTIVNGAVTNQWNIGTALANGGSKSIYISNDLGVTNAYTTNSVSTVHFYRDITFPANCASIILSFDFQGMGEPANWDYMRVYLFDTTQEISAGTEVPSSDHLAQFLSVNSWATQSILLDAANSGLTKRLVFTWRNDGSGGTQPPAAIDNISIDYVIATPEPSPAILVSPVDGITDVSLTQTLNWQASGGSAPTGYDLYFGETNPPAFIADLGLVTTWTPTDFEYSTTYYWQVVPYNAEGDASNCPVWSFTTMDDPSIVDFPYFENFDSVTAPAFPIGWGSINIATTSYAYSDIYSSTYSSYSPTNCLRLANSSDLAAILIASTPPVTDITNKRVKFFAKGTNYPLIIGTMSNQADETTFEAIETITLSSDYTEYMVSLAGATNDNLAFKHGLGGTYRTIYIDDITIENLPTTGQYSANADSLGYGNVELNRTKTLSYTVSNTGAADLTLAYSLPTEISTDNVNITLPAGETQEISFMFTPAVEGEYSDEINLTTNDPDALTITIPVTAFVLPPIAEGIVQIGDGEITNLNLPINPFYGYNYSQTIYLQEELNRPDNQITKIYYYWNGIESGEDYIDWAIYMGHTDLSGFAADSLWIPQEDLTEVFNGQVIIPAEEGWVEITLTAPFFYNNTQNLVVAVNETTQGYGSSSAKFFGSVTPDVNRALRVQNDSNAYDLAALPDSGTLVQGYANTRLLFEDLPSDPIFAVNPNEKDFGLILLGEESNPQAFTISNIGTGLISISSIVLSGDDIDQFTLTNENQLPVSLDSGDNISVSVVFVPTSEGVKTAELLITDDLTRVVHTVNITGEGVNSAVTTFPYVQDFEITPPMFWLRMSGLLAEEPELTEYEGSWSSFSHWSIGDFANDAEHINGQGARVNIYGTTMNRWLVTPELVLAEGTGTYTVTFDMALTAYSGVDPDTTGIDDIFAVIISPDNGETWSSLNTLALWDNQTSPRIFNDISNTGETVSLALPSITGSVRLAFYGESTISNADNYVHIDNVTISYDASEFLAPQNLTATSGDGSVDLNWDAPSRDLAGYKVYRDGEAITETITATTYLDEAVENGVTYSYYVTAVYTEPVGESAPSNIVEATPAGSGDLLFPPSNLEAQVNGNNVVLGWDEPGGDT